MASCHHYSHADAGRRVKHGKTPKECGAGYIENSSLEPISPDANAVQYFASQGFHGGYNTCTEVGFFSQTTFDFDLQNAYATVMCLIPDQDWVNIIEAEISNRDLNLSDFTLNGDLNPLRPFVGYITFEFPPEVYYPCIPINVDGVPVYPRTSKGLNGVYVAGPYVYLALKPGAHVQCKKGYFLTIRRLEDGSESRSLSTVVKQLVTDRNKAKGDHGKGCLEELALKEIVCSGYGKIGNITVKGVSSDPYTSYGGSCISLKTPARAGYTFKGWYGSNGATEDNPSLENPTISASSSGNKVYTAKWELNKYKISYNLHGGQSDKELPLEYTVESDDIALAEPKRK